MLPSTNENVRKNTNIFIYNSHPFGDKFARAFVHIVCGSESIGEQNLKCSTNGFASDKVHLYNIFCL